MSNVFPIRTDLLTVAWFIRQRLHGNRSNGALCRRCGYDVTARASHLCSECGADLRRVGIVHVALIRRWPVFVAVATMLFWTLMILACASLFNGPVRDWLFPSMMIASDVDRSWQPSSEAYWSIDIEAKAEWNAEYDASPRPVDIIIVWITQRDSPSLALPVLWIDPRTMRMEHRSERHPEGKLLEASLPADPKAAFEHWWQAAGLDPDDLKQRIELEGIWQLIYAARGADMQQYQQVVQTAALQNLRWVSGGFRSTSIPAPRWARAVLNVGWLLVWLAGLAALLMLANRRLQVPTL